MQIIVNCCIFAKMQIIAQIFSVLTTPTIKVMTNIRNYKRASNT